MTNPKHTPEPWHRQHDARSGHTDIRGPSGELIASVTPETETHEADARLIAAAPDLLAAARHICDEIGGGGTASAATLLLWKRKLRAALRKAVGDE